LISNELFNSLPITYNSSWVKKQARVCVPISGDCSRLGPPKPWTRTFPEPAESNCYVQLLSCAIFSSYLQGRCQTIKSFNQFALA
jgi:hypothetical protein